jgi:lipopolysaccharide transport system ATP-binding protein
MNETVVKVEGVSKKYCRTIKHTMLYGTTDLTRSFLGLNQKTERLRDGEFWAVDDVNFELKRGETLGIIGPNGSGKSTVLKLLNGIFMPDKGRIEIKGRVGALIEVGAGFHPMLTGRENIYINGAILGMTKREIDRKFDEIVGFADIGDFIDAPVKHYSSGMHVRLGFAIAVHCEPDILLVDEVLAVGDYRFQQKALNKMLELRDSGMSIILVSHNIHAVRFFCVRGLAMNHGGDYFIGDINHAIQKYQAESNLSIDMAFSKESINKGSDLVEITSVELFDRDYKRKRVFNNSESMTLKVEYFAKSRLPRPILSFRIIRDDGLNCLAGMSTLANIHLDSIEGKGSFKVRLKRLNLTSGKYMLGITIFNENLIPYGAGLNGEFVVKSDYPRTGRDCPVFLPEQEWYL